MTSTELIRVALEEFKANELIIATKLYHEKLSSQISEATFYKALERMCKSGELVRIAKGTYHIPKKGKYGIIPPSEKEIVAAFTANETGMEIGYTLYNALNLTTQIPKTITILSSALEGFSKTIRNVVIEQQQLVFSEPIKQTVASLEVLQNYATIQDLNPTSFLKFTAHFAETFNALAFDEVQKSRKYQKATVSFASEILSHYQVENNLSKYLSTLSTYKHPTMEELYEAARIQQ